MIKFIGNSELSTNNLYEISNIGECSNWLKTLDWVALDTETEGFFDHKNKIVMLQLYNAVTDTAFVIDVRYISILPLKESLENLLVIGQNLKFDYKFLKFHGIELNNVVDTFLNECILTNGLENRKLGLGELALKYCNKVLNKVIRNQFIRLNGQPFTNSQIVYGVDDVICLKEIADKQQIELEKLELTNIAKLEYDATLALGDIEYNGLGFNSNAWLELAKKAESKIPEHEKQLDQLVEQESKLSKYIKKHIQLGMFDVEDRKINIKWSSPIQVLQVFKDLGLDIESSGEKDIQKYQTKYPIIEKFITYKKDSKLVTTYGKDFLRYINSQTKRVHADFWQILDTHRVSCGGSKSKNKSSVNLQNLPAKNEYLNCFIAKPGYKIIGVDYAAQEGRIAAYGSKDEVWLNTFLAGKDLHSEVCKMMFNITDDLVKTKPDFLRGKTYRDVAKTINFGALFGMSKFKLANTLMISIEEAEALLTKYFKATKQLKTYLDNCANYGLVKGYIRSFKPYSCIRYFSEWKPNLDNKKDFKIIGEISRACYNTPIQATGATMTKLALTKIRKYIKENNLQDNVSIIHVVHDAIYTECKVEIVDWFSEKQAELMQEAGKEFTDVLTFETDITIEDYWTK